MKDKNLEKMAKIIQEKKERSAAQGGKKMNADLLRAPAEARPGIKKFKKGGLFDK